MNNVINLNDYRTAKEFKNISYKCPLCGNELTNDTNTYSCTKCLFSYDESSSFTDMTGLNEFDICTISNYFKENPYIDITDDSSIWQEVIDCYSRGKDYLGEILVSYLNYLYKKC